MIPEWAQAGTIAGMSEPRKLVKARLAPPLHAQVVAYAEATHRSASSAAEYLIAAGLRSLGQDPAAPYRVTQLPGQATLPLETRAG